MSQGLSMQSGPCVRLVAICQGHIPRILSCPCKRRLSNVMNSTEVGARWLVGGYGGRTLSGHSYRMSSSRHEVQLETASSRDASCLRGHSPEPSFKIVKSYTLT